MNKILLYVSIALVFLFSAAGVTVAVARQSQSGESLYPLRTWSTQILQQQEKTQLHAEAKNVVQMQSGFHQQENLTTPQSVGQSDICNQPGAIELCGFEHEVGINQQSKHLVQEHNRTGSPAGDASHTNGGTDHNKHECDHRLGGHH